VWRNHAILNMGVWADTIESRDETSQMVLDALEIVKKMESDQKEQTNIRQRARNKIRLD
jgi:hypothetical protein